MNDRNWGVPIGDGARDTYSLLFFLILSYFVSFYLFFGIPPYYVVFRLILLYFVYSRVIPELCLILWYFVLFMVVFHLNCGIPSYFVVFHLYFFLLLFCGISPYFVVFHLILWYSAWFCGIPVRQSEDQHAFLHFTHFEFGGRFPSLVKPQISYS